MQDYSWVLSEEKINETLRRDFIGNRIRINLDGLVNKVKYVPTKRTKESVARNYSIGFHIRDFLREERISMRFITGEVLPLVFSPIYVVEDFKNLFGNSTGNLMKEGLRQLDAMQIIDMRYLNFDVQYIQLNDFDTIKRSAANEAFKHRDIVKSDLEGKFENELGMFRGVIDTEIREPINLIYERYKDSGFKVPFTKFIISTKI